MAAATPVRSCDNTVMGQSSFQDHFSGHADDYRHYRPGYPKPLFAYLAARAPERRLAWDCATGNGQAAAQLTDYFDQVIATDASAAQIDHAPATERVSFRCAPAEASGLEAASVDLVTVAQALHWLDFDRFYAEVRRVLKPGGVLAAWCYGLFRSSPAVDRIVGRFYEQVVGPYWPPERRWIDEGYATLPFPFPELPAPQFAMQRQWTLPQLLGYMNTWSAVRRYTQAHGVNPLDEIDAELASAWPRNAETMAVNWNVRLRVGRYAAKAEV